MYKDCFKRVIDFTIALIAILCIWWFLIIITIWLYFANKGSLTPDPSKGEGRNKRWWDYVFFLQDRPGKDEKIFKVIKFKTMTDERDENGELLPDAERLTKVGRFVRSTSIDELPQLINVLKGDMSLIGPRPLLVYYLPWYTTEQARRHEVRPGITGWAQVNGRNFCKLSKKFEYDVWYVEHCTLATDIKILWMTIKNVIKRKDIGDGAENMENVDDLGFHERYLKMIEEGE